jgi:hypothetical protein
MPVLDATFVGKLYLPEVGGGPIIPPGQPVEPPLGIWGPPGPWPTPPIYIPVPPPDEKPPEGGAPPGEPAHPIYIPVYPAHPIIIPLPPDPGEEPDPPYVWPPQIWGGPIIPPEGKPPGTPSHPWVPPSSGAHPEHPIYIPAPPGQGGTPEHPIYLPVYPTHPIVLPPEGEHPKPPPDMINPPEGARGFWAYSVYYDCWVFVPYEGSGLGPTPPGGAGRR